MGEVFGFSAPIFELAYHSVWCSVPHKAIHQGLAETMSWANTGGGFRRISRDEEQPHSVKTDRAQDSLYQNMLKPVLDRILGSILLLISLPLILISMGIVFASLGAPIFYRQPRIGKDGRTFHLLKLRTMIPDRRASASNGFAGPERRHVHKSTEDPRVPPACRKLRAMRLDEFPQFWNVITGDMSLVGPRPELPEIVETYAVWQHRRHEVKPGLTGLWQVSARNGKLMHECTDIDLEYLDNISLLGDLRILAVTPLAMLGKRQGY